MQNDQPSENRKTTTAKAEGQVSSAVRDLNAVLEKVGEYVVALEDQLEPVMRECPPEPSDKTEDDSAVVALACKIDFQASLAARVKDRLCSILDRLEI